jgi:hypothetical protein
MQRAAEQFRRLQTPVSFMQATNGTVASVILQPFYDRDAIVSLALSMRTIVAEPYK